MIITERAKRVGRAAVAARYRSESERKPILAGKRDDTPNVRDASLAAQLMMDSMLPALTICEIALDNNDLALLRVTRSDLKKALDTH
jgi:hypothetical protein